MKSEEIKGMKKKKEHPPPLPYTVLHSIHKYSQSKECDKNIYLINHYRWKIVSIYLIPSSYVGPTDFFPFFYGGGLYCLTVRRNCCNMFYS